jgi:hypothetical protein
MALIKLKRVIFMLHIALFVKITDIKNEVSDDHQAKA